MSNLANSGHETVIHNTPGAGALHHDSGDSRSQHGQDQNIDERMIRYEGNTQPVSNPPNVNSDPVYDGSLGAVPRTRQGDGQHLGDLPQHIQDQINAFRSGNQAANIPINRPSGNVQISQLRANPDLRRQVEVGVTSLREQIPSLSAAPSAPTFPQFQHIPPGIVTL